jgi:hypothetical protein
MSCRKNALYHKGITSYILHHKPNTFIETDVLNFFLHQIYWNQINHADQLIDKTSSRNCTFNDNFDIRCDQILLCSPMQVWRGD